MPRKSQHELQVLLREKEGEQWRPWTHIEFDDEPTIGSNQTYLGVLVHIDDIDELGIFTTRIQTERIQQT